MAARKKPTKYAEVTKLLPKMPINGFEESEERAALLERVTETIMAPAESEEQAAAAERLIPDAIGRITEGFKDLTAGILRRTAGKPRASEFGRAWAEGRETLDQIEALVSNVSLALEAYQTLLLNHMDTEGLTSLGIANGGSISTWEEPYAQVTDPEVFRKWCFRNKLANKMTLAWGSTDSMVKAMLLRGENLPPGIKAWSKPKLRLGQ